MTNLIHIDSVNNVDVVDSRLIAIELGIKHQTFLETIRKYETQLQAFGVFTFEKEKPLKGSNGGRPETFVYLNEEQATFVMTLSRNTKKVVNCKMKLVKSFSQAKEIIKGQSEQIEILKLQNEQLRLQKDVNQSSLALREFNHFVTTALPEPMQQKILGYSEVVKEVVKEKVIYQDQVIRDGSTLNKTQLCHRYGFLTKSGKPNYKQLNAKLEALNIPSEVWELKVAFRENQEFKSEYLDKLDELLLNDDRQMFLGE